MNGSWLWSRRTMLVVTGVAAVLAVVGVGVRAAGWPIPPAVVALGGLIGILYGILAVGLILIFRASRVINLAIGAMGIFGATIFQILAVNLRLPFGLAFAAGLVAAAATGAATDMVVVRRFARAPRILVIILTLGVAVLLASLIAPLDQIGDSLEDRLLLGEYSYSGPRPTGEPPLLPELQIGPLLVSPRHLLLAMLTPLLLGGMVYVLYRTRVGLAVRAVAGNTELVELAGVPARMITTGVWAASAAAATLGTILGPVQVGGSAVEQSPYSLVLRALVAAVLARMHSIPAAFSVGILTGIAEQVLLWNSVNLGWLDGAILVILLVEALAARRLLGRSGDGQDTGWTMVAADTGWPAPYRTLRLVRIVRVAGLVGVIAVLAAVPLFADTFTLRTLAAGCGFAIACLSVYVLAGVSGQLSLGQFAIAGLGALVSVAVLARTGVFAAAAGAAVVAGAATAAVLGVLAVRRPGTSLAAVTLTAAGLIPVLLLAQPWAFGDGAEPGLPIIGALTPTAGTIYQACLAILLGCLLLVQLLRNGRIGQALVAARDNPPAAHAFGVAVGRIRLLAFLFAGALAALGGVLVAHASPTVTPGQFAQDLSVQLVLAVVVGGLASVSGALVGSVWLFALPHLLPGTGLATSATAVGGLLLLLYFPGGITQAWIDIRNYLLGVLRPHLPTPEEAATSPRSLPEAGTDAQPTRSQPALDNSQPVLVVDGLSKAFGGIAAVRDVSLAIQPGEILAVIGPNGAGKSTLFDLISGFERPDTGRVTCLGRDITSWQPERRSHLGLIRSFQEPQLFPTMTVEQVLQVAATAHHSSRGRRRTTRTQIHSALGYFGLTQYREHRVRELSTGTRRLVELAAVHTLSPQLLLLDEPSSGIAQREAEALGGLLRRMRDDLHLTIALIEHDLPLAFGLADRVAVMLEGRLLTIDTPDRIRANPDVIIAYLGTNVHQPRHGSPRPDTTTVPASTLDVQE